MSVSTPENVCLSVRAPEGVDLTNPTVVQVRIVSGDVSIVDVVPCAGDETPTVDPAPPGSEWSVGDIEFDALTDEPSVVVALAASSGADRFGNPVILVIRCSGGNTDVFVGWQDYLGSDDQIDVDMRLGDADIATRRWNLSTSNTATFYPGDAVEFVKSLFGEDRLVLRATPYNEAPTTAEFNLTGAEDAVAKVREVCGW